MVPPVAAMVVEIGTMVGVAVGALPAGRGGTGGLAGADWVGVAVGSWAPLTSKSVKCWVLKHRTPSWSAVAGWRSEMKMPSVRRPPFCGSIQNGWIWDWSRFWTSAHLRVVQNWMVVAKS